jgi:hypothetical protein
MKYRHPEPGEACLLDDLPQPGLPGLGIQAVPTFVFDGRYGVSGAQPASAFMQVLERVWEETVGAAAAEGNSGDADCADGSCAV